MQIPKVSAPSSLRVTVTLFGPRREGPFCGPRDRTTNSTGAHSSGLLFLQFSFFPLFFSFLPFSFFYFFLSSSALFFVLFLFSLILFLLLFFFFFWFFFFLVL